MDTIFALASARGKSGVAVIRVSGEQAFAACSALCGRLPEPRKASLRRLHHRGIFLDEALVLVFGAGASFTGEPSVEFQIHGGLATIRVVLEALGDQPGLRMAEPGEFSRRALENGCLDLTQIEGLADVIDAETEAQRRQAVAVMSGALGRRAEGWRVELVHALALTEVTIDFSDEDVPDAVFDDVLSVVQRVKTALKAELAGTKAAERIRDGFEVAIVGAPNVGKSTLLNALAGRQAAITSEIAGTTRDVIEVRMEISGLAVTVLDTAGLRDAEDVIEQKGIELALERAKRADLRVFLMGGDGQLLLEPMAEDLVLRGKADLGDDGPDAVSGLTGQGVDRLVASIGEILSQRVAGSSLVIRERHRQALAGALEHLTVAEDFLRGQGPVELVSDEMRSAARRLEVMIGKVGVEDLLDEIFLRFCIGK